MTRIGATERHEISPTSFGGRYRRTNTRLHSLKQRPRCALIAKKPMPVVSTPAPEATIAAFLDLHRVALTRACFGIAGAREKRRCEATNLPGWLTPVGRDSFV